MSMSNELVSKFNNLGRISRSNSGVSSNKFAAAAAAASEETRYSATPSAKHSPVRNALNGELFGRNKLKKTNSRHLAGTADDPKPTVVAKSKIPVGVNKRPSSASGSSSSAVEMLAKQFQSPSIQKSNGNVGPPMPALKPVPKARPTPPAAASKPFRAVLNRSPVRPKPVPKQVIASKIAGKINNLAAGGALKPSLPAKKPVLPAKKQSKPPTLPKKPSLPKKVATFGTANRLITAYNNNNSNTTKQQQQQPQQPQMPVKSASEHHLLPRRESPDGEVSTRRFNGERPRSLVAAHAHQAQGANEVTVKAGELVTCTDNNDVGGDSASPGAAEWIFVETAAHSSGWAPRDCFEAPAYSNTGGGALMTSASCEEEIYSEITDEIEYQVKYDISEPSHDTALCVDQGDTVVLLEAANQDWWFVRVVATRQRPERVGGEGWIPPNYLSRTSRT